MARCAIRERLRAAATRHTRDTVRTVLIRPYNQALIAIALIVLRLRSRSTSQTLAPVAVLARATLNALMPLLIRLRSNRTRATRTTRIRDVHVSKLAAVSTVRRSRHCRWLFAGSAVQALQTVGTVLTNAGIAARTLQIRLFTGLTSNTRRAVRAVPECVVLRVARLASSQLLIRLTPRITARTRIASRRHIRIADNRTRLASCAIREWLRASHASDARDTVSTILIRPDNKT